jgi:predicted transcriptional regulator
MLVKDIYRNNPIAIKETATIKDAVKMFLERGSNGVLVINEDDNLVGILSLQDIVGGIVPAEMKEHSNLAHSMYKESFFKDATLEIAERSVKEIMRKEFLIANLQTNVMEIATDFLTNDLYIVPVVEDKELVGVVSRSELKHALAAAMNLHTKNE